MAPRRVTGPGPGGCGTDLIHYSDSVGAGVIDLDDDTCRDVVVVLAGADAADRHDHDPAIQWHASVEPVSFVLAAPVEPCRDHRRRDAERQRPAGPVTDPVAGTVDRPGHHTHTGHTDTDAGREPTRDVTCSPGRAGEVRRGSGAATRGTPVPDLPAVDVARLAALVPADPPMASCRSLTGGASHEWTAVALLAWGRCEHGWAAGVSFLWMRPPGAARGRLGLISTWVPGDWVRRAGGMPDYRAVPRVTLIGPAPGWPALPGRYTKTSFPSLPHAHVPYPDPSTYDECLLRATTALR